MKRRFLRSPNLPRTRVISLIIGARYRSRLQAVLHDLQVEVFWLEDNPSVDSRLCGHADMGICNPAEKRFIISPDFIRMNAQSTVWLKDLGAEIEEGGTLLSPGYPREAAYNLCAMGTTLLYNPHTADPVAANCFSGCNRVRVRQGYTRCAACPVAPETLITGDAGIAGACEKAGLEVLLLEEPFVELEGYAHGFLGGAAFLLQENTLALTGIIPDARMRRKLTDFLRFRGIELLYLTRQPIFDIGSAILVEEEAK